MAVARARLAGVPFSYAERLGYSTVPGNSLRDAGGAPASGSSSTFFLQEFGLSNEDGIALMCISEASLRIPAIDNPGRLYRRGTHSGADRHMSGIVPGMLMEAPHSRPGVSLPLHAGFASGPATPTSHGAHAAGRYAPVGVCSMEGCNRRCGATPGNRQRIQMISTPMSSASQARFAVSAGRCCSLAVARHARSPNPRPRLRVAGR